MSYSTKHYASEFKPTRTRYIEAGSSNTSPASVIIWTLFFVMFCIAPAVWYFLH